MRPLLPALLLALLAAPGCRIVRIDSPGSGGVESHGLVEGHVAFGVPRNDQLLDIDLLHGGSDGAIAGVEVWKLVRVEVGLAGASLGLGPIDVGLGVLFYHPEVTRGPRPGAEARPEPAKGVEDEAGPRPERFEEDDGLEWEPAYGRD